MRTRYPFFLAAAFYAVLVCIFTAQSLPLTAGHLTYGLDDAYIHLAVAKQLAFHGVWGNSSAGFSGVSSSLLWTLLVALLFRIFGNFEILPYILNIVFGIVLLWVLEKLWQRIGLQPLWRIFLFAIAFCAVPLASEPIIGMEVSLECLIVAAFLYAIIFWTDRPSKREEIILVVLALLLGAVRYECIAVVEIVAFGFLFRGEWLRSLMMAVAGVLPATIYAFIAVGNGGSPVPNTLFLKSVDIETILRFLPNGWELIITLIAVAIAGWLLLLLISQFVRRLVPMWKPSGKLLASIASIISAVILIALSNSGQQFERYRAFGYLDLVIVLGLVLQIVLSQPVVHRSKIYFAATALCVLCIVALLAPKFFFYVDKTPVSSKNIWDEQIQMARFVERYYAMKPVVLIDIGAVSYFTDSPVIDIIGLGTDSIARLRLKNGDVSNVLNPFLDRTAAPLAITYPILLYEPDSNWKKVGSLEMENSYVCASEHIDFYALHNSDTAWLRSSLADFAPRTTSKVVIY